VARFSRLAFASVLVLVGTGIYAGVREVGSLVALMTTDYGKLLVVKVNLVLFVVAVAGTSRSWVQRNRPARLSAAGQAEPAEADKRELVLAGGRGPASRGNGFGTVAPRRHTPESTQSGGGNGDSVNPSELRSLRRSVLVEVVIAIAVLTVTAVLVATQPAKTAVPATATERVPTSTTATVAAGPGTVRVSTSLTGPRQLTIRLSTLDANKRLQPVPELTAALRLPSQGLGPLPVELTPGGPGQFVADNVTLPLAGTWQLSLSVRANDFDAYSAQTSLPVR
jgi:copper transport protein